MTNNQHGQVPAIQRYKIGYHSDEWGVRSLSPTGIYDDAGPWVRYEDHAAVITALRTTHVQNPAEIEHVAGDVSKNGAELNVSTQQQECGNTPYDEGPFALAQPVAQRGAADGFFLLLPQRPKPEAPAGTAGLDWDAYSGAQMLAFGRDCSDAAIAALRTQQPAPATQKLKEQICISDTNQSAACAAGSVGTTSDARTTRSTHDAPATQPSPEAQAADSVLEDAARWQWLADYLIGERTDLDEGIVACATIDALRQFADAARKQGANHD